MIIARSINSKFTIFLLIIFLVSCSDESTKTTQSPPTIATAEEIKSETVAIEYNANVIVIGAGIAGLSTAIEAARNGHSVMVIDMASVFGGHSLVSGGGLAIINTAMQREKEIEDSIDLAFNDFVEWGDDVNLEWVRYYVKNSNEEIYEWLIGLGVEFTNFAQPPGNSVPRMHFVKERGLGLLRAVYKAALINNNISFKWNTRADELILHDGHVVGTKVTNIRTKQTDDLYGHSIMIATGGFQSNLEKVLENWRSDLTKLDRILAGSGWNSQGSGLKLATDAGANLERLNYMWNYIDGVPDPRHTSGDRGLRILNSTKAIWLSNEGNRFVNECQSYKVTLPAILEQPDQSHWMVFDDNGKKTINIAASGWTPEKVEAEIFSNEEILKSGKTLDELAEKISVSKETLNKSITHYNAMVDQGQDEDFGRFGPDAVFTARCKNISKIEKAPFYAVKRFPLARKSLGGIDIDIKGHALTPNAEIIPGLFAAGEASGFAGINGKAGLEGTFLGPSIVTGRVAGRTITSELSEIAVVPLKKPDMPTTEARASIDPAMPSLKCNTCHNLSSMVSLKRPGYLHFESVHQRVMEKDLQCSSCHSEMLPYNPATHKIDPLTFVDTCQNCHSPEN